MKTPLISVLLATTICLPVFADDAADALFAEWDLNANGEITELEARTRLTSIFATFDTNMDGYLDDSDAESNVDTDEEEDSATAVEFDDDDGDERVSMLEFLDRAASWIDMMDRNDDGLVTTADFTATSSS